MTTARELLPEGYTPFLSELKTRIRQAQSRTALAVNSALIELYWGIGEMIVQQQESAQWGDSVLEQLSHDLRRDFPDLKGFSRRHLYRMRAFYLAYREQPEFVPQVVAQIPWGHNTMLLEKLKAAELREWYARATIQHGWSRAVLEVQIETPLHKRQGAALSGVASVW